MKKTGKKYFINLTAIDGDTALTKFRKELLSIIMINVKRNFDSDEGLLKLGISEFDVDAMLNGRWDMFTVDRLVLLSHFIENDLVLSKENIKNFEMDQIQKSYGLRNENSDENLVFISKEGVSESLLKNKNTDPRKVVQQVLSVPKKPNDAA